MDHLNFWYGLGYSSTINYSLNSILISVVYDVSIISLSKVVVKVLVWVLYGGFSILYYVVSY